MASSTSNTAAGIFTQIPKSISKIWKPKPVLVKTGVKLESISSKHEYSLIEQIEVIITYVTLPEEDEEILCESEDTSENKIEGWRDIKRTWEIIDNSVSKCIQSIEQSILKSSHQRQMVSTDVLMPYKTTYKKQPKLQTIPESNEAAINRHHANIRSKRGYAKTIIPSDSISAVNYADVYSEIASQARKKRGKKSSHSSTKKARDLMSMTIRSRN
jgi:hypothetical protein